MIRSTSTLRMISVNWSTEGLRPIKLEVFFVVFLMIRTNSAEKSSLNIANPIREEAKKHRTPLFSLSLMGPREGAPRMLITPPTIHQYSRFIFLWRSIDFLLFSLPLIPGSVSSVAFYRGAIIRGLITTPLAAYLLPGDSLFKPLPNDLGKLTCSTSQGCGASLMSEGVAPMQGLLVLLKKKREREREKERQETVLPKPPSHIFAPTLYLMSRHAGGQGKPYVQEDSLKWPSASQSWCQSPFRLWRCGICVYDPYLQCQNRFIMIWEKVLWG